MPVVELLRQPQMPPSLLYCGLPCLLSEQVTVLLFFENVQRQFFLRQLAVPELYLRKSYHIMSHLTSSEIDKDRSNFENWYVIL